MALEDEITGIYNVGCRGKISKADFFEEFCLGLGINDHAAIRKNYDQRVFGPRPLDMSMCCCKAKNAGFRIPEVQKVINSVTQEYLRA